MLQPKVTIVAHSNGHGCQRPLTTRIYTLLSNDYCGYYNEMAGWVLVRYRFTTICIIIPAVEVDLGYYLSISHLCQRQKHIHNNYMV